MTNNERVKKCHAAKRERGECRACKLPAFPGQLRCAVHMEQHARRVRLSREANARGAGGYPGKSKKLESPLEGPGRESGGGCGGVEWGAVECTHPGVWTHIPT
jgi:hypothetical protein